MIAPLLRALAMAVVSSAGCTFALVQGTSQEVRFDSDPPGARVTFGQLSGVAPCVLEVPRSGKPRTVRFELAGHEPLSMKVMPRSWSGVVPALALALDVVTTVAVAALFATGGGALPIRGPANGGLWGIPDGGTDVDLFQAKYFHEWPSVIRAELVPLGLAGGHVALDRE